MDIISLRKLLGQCGMRWTPEREAVWIALNGSEKHLGAEELLEEARCHTDRKISLATIYRTISLFVQIGLVRQIMDHNGERVLYEAVMGQSHHDHLVCSQCGHVVEFSVDHIERMQEQIARQYGYQLISHCHDLIGVCEDCQKTQIKPCEKLEK